MLEAVGYTMRTLNHLSESDHALYIGEIVTPFLTMGPLEGMEESEGEGVKQGPYRGGGDGEWKGHL